MSEFHHKIINFNLLTKSSSNEKAFLMKSRSVAHPTHRVPSEKSLVATKMQSINVYIC